MPIVKELCFWCKRPKRTVFLNEAVHKGTAYIHNYRYCKDCEEKYGEHILVFESTDTPLNIIPFQPKFGAGYPTGRYVVVHINDFDELTDFLEFNGTQKSLVRKLKHKYIAVPPELFNELKEKGKPE